MEKKYIERLFDKKLECYLRSVGAVQIVGPKWCGKSKLLESFINHLKKEMET